MRELNYFKEMLAKVTEDQYIMLNGSDNTIHMLAKVTEDQYIMLNRSDNTIHMVGSFTSSEAEYVLSSTLHDFGKDIRKSINEVIAVDDGSISCGIIPAIIMRNEFPLYEVDGKFIRVLYDGDIVISFVADCKYDVYTLYISDNYDIIGITGDSDDELIQKISLLIKEQKDIILFHTDNAPINKTITITDTVHITWGTVIAAIKDAGNASVSFSMYTYDANGPHRLDIDRNSKLILRGFYGIISDYLKKPSMLYRDDLSYFDRLCAQLNLLPDDTDFSNRSRITACNIPGMLVYHGTDSVVLINRGILAEYQFIIFRKVDGVDTRKTIADYIEHQRDIDL